MNIISERKNLLTKYGFRVKSFLLKNGKTQEWLIAEVKKKLPQKYLDCSNLNKILTGRLNSPDIQSAIDEIIAERKKAQ